MPRKEWYAKNPESGRSHSLKSYRKNRTLRIASMQEWRESHPEKVREHADRSRMRKQERVEANKLRVREYKLLHPCSCGYADPRALVFHHRDPKEKDFPISRKLSLPWEKLMVEISKCDVLCANCHTIIHCGV